MNKEELIKFGNLRSSGNKEIYSSYDDYINWQTINGCSFESKNEHWKSGQKNYLSKNFNELDRSLKIADICCGDGIGLEYFKEMGFTNIIGFEVADNKIEIAKNHGFKIVKKDICLESFEDEFLNYFDVLYSSHTLEHVLNPIYTIENMLKTLKVGGLFYLVLPYPNIVDTSNMHAYMVHCGSEPLSLNVVDDANTTQIKLESLGLELVSKKFDSFREDEVWFIFKKL